MLLAIDIGNTSIYFGEINNGEIGKTFRITTKKNITSDEYTILIKNILEENINIKDIEAIIMSSVVPEIIAEVEKALFNITSIKTILLKRDITNSFDLPEEFFRDLGSDLIADATGAIAKYKLPVIVFDMGTATTCSVVDKNGVFCGGMICPGLKTSVDALIGNASQLSEFRLGNPKQIIGIDTSECINAGAIYGHSSMINGLRKRVEEEREENCTVILTGGNSDYVANYVDADIIHDKHLIFYGLNALYEEYKNKGEKLC